MMRVVPLSCCSNELRVAGDAGGEVRRQSERLVERIGVERLRMALRRRHGLYAGADRRCYRRPAL